MNLTNRLTENAERAIDPDRIALSIQQPWAELILQGSKTIEVRKRATRIRGTVYLYAGRQFSTLACAWVPLADGRVSPEGFPQGGLVGQVDLLDCRPARPDDFRMACVSADLLHGRYSWVLGNAVRFPKLIPVTCLPFGPWFYPFQRRGKNV